MRTLSCFAILTLAFASGCATGDYAQSKDIEELRQEIQALRAEVKELKQAAVLSEPRSIDLPKVAIAPREVDAAHLVISISEDNKIYLAAKEVTAEKLTEELKAAAAKDPKVRVVLRADDAVPHKKVVEVMDLARSAGVEDIVFAIVKD
jgi:biopolymer transport protein ExbD